MDEYLNKYLKIKPKASLSQNYIEYSYIFNSHDQNFAIGYYTNTDGKLERIIYTDNIDNNDYFDKKNNTITIIENPMFKNNLIILAFINGYTDYYTESGINRFFKLLKLAKIA